MRRTAAVALILIVGASFAGISMLPQARAKTFYVGGTGPGNYTSIQGAVNVAGAGDTVFVYNGTYYASILIHESIHLVGEDRDNTIIDGRGAGNVIHFSDSSVSIRSLTVTNSKSNWTYAGVKVYSGSVHLTDSRIINNFIGVHIRYGSGSAITNNLFLSNTLESIYLEESSENAVVGNTFMNNGCGIGLGGTSTANTITGNNISSSPGAGIWMSGLLGMQPGGNTVHKNVISDSHEGIFLWNGYGNDITFNNFIDNDVSAFLMSDERFHCFTNDWDYNYWSDYNGTDADGDGIGDSPHEIACDEHGRYHYNNSDYHPRMYKDMRFPSSPSEPRDLIARADLLSITLRWKPPLEHRGSPITGYRIYRRTSSGTFKPLGETAKLTFEDLQLIALGLGPRTYYYRVSAVNGEGEGAPSNLAEATLGSLPGSPRDLSASLGGAGSKDIVIGWTLSVDDNDGNGTIAVYDIFRNAYHDPTGRDYELIATLPRASQEFVDVGAGEGGITNYFYRVCATTYSNTTSCSDHQAGKFFRPLAKGILLISIPFTQISESIGDVLRTVSFNRVWTFDAHIQEWKSYYRFKEYSTLARLNSTMGIWINVTEKSNLTVAGTIPPEVTINLYRGWNLVGYPSFDPLFTVAELKSAVHVRDVEGFDSLAPPFFLTVLQDADYLGPGLGYWIQASEDSVWIVSNM